MTLPREPGPHPTAAADDTRQVRRRSAGCARRGSGWTVELDGHRTEVQHSVGMVYLAILLANPGYEIPAAELAAAAAPPGTAAADPSPVSAQPVLDEVARREYRRRLSTLQAEIDRYESRNDAERAARASAERDWLVDLLRAAAGLGGRVRQFAGTDERARIAVGKAIRRALDRIAHADPAIGGQLRVTVQTGVRCCYRPG